MAKKKDQRSKVFLVAYAVDGGVIERIELSYEQYYSGSTAVIDKNVYRAQNGVRRLTGEIYDAKGKLQQTFDNSYDDKGKYLRGRIVYDDGTVAED